MSNAPPQGSPGAPHLSYSTPATGPAPRRSSYASVAAGVPAYSSTDSPSSAIPNTRSYSSATPLPSVQLPRINTGDQPSRIPQPVFDPESQPDDGVTLSTSGGRGQGSMTHHSSRRLSGQGTGHGGGGMGYQSFFRPTYLRGTTYLEKLEQAHHAKMVALEQEQLNRSYNPGSLSTSSSSASLHKMAPSHRGMTYDIVENQMTPIEYGPSPLPSRWAQIDKWGGLEIGADGVDVKYVGPAKLSDQEGPAARTNHHMPRECGIYYYEVNVLQRGKDGFISIGFSGTKASLERLPGWEPDSWAYHGDDGMSFCGQSTGKPYGPQFTTGDIIGCGVNFLNNQAFFTKNGVFLGYAFREMREIKLYPSVGMKRPNAHLEANFGQRPFCFDIDGMFKRKQYEITQAIRDVDISALQPPLHPPSLSKAELCKVLVAQYLSHDGYNETAKAFAREVRSEELGLRGPDADLSFGGYLSGEEDGDASQRQQIRTAILDGHIDNAITLTERYYPHVLADLPQIFFKLKCRKFVEMMRLSTEYLDAATGVRPAQSKRSKKGSLNGHHITAHSDDGLDPEPEMDLDDPAPMMDRPNLGKGLDIDRDRMDTELTGKTAITAADSTDDSSSSVSRQIEATLKHQALLNEMVSYGRELKQQFKEDQSKLVTDTMTEIFGMFAYPDPRKSEQAHLLDTRERVPVAEAVNGAILASIGKSPMTILERLYRQTVVLTDIVSEDGGVGSFVNVRDLLRAVGGDAR